MIRILSKNSAAYVAVAAAIIVGVLLIADHAAIRNQLDKWKMLPQPERLSELYFTDSQHVPAKYQPGQNLPVNFAVHNLEGRAASYRYTVIEQNQSGTSATMLASGAFSLAQNAVKNITSSVQSADFGSRAKIIVTLIDQHIAINYWVTKGA